MCTKDIKDSFGFISFTRDFTYLESVISYDLDDFFDISICTKKSNQAMGTLNLFWDSEHVDISTKVKIYLAIQGFPNLGSQESIDKKVRGFQHEVC